MLIIALCHHRVIWYFHRMIGLCPLNPYLWDFVIPIQIASEFLWRFLFNVSIMTTLKVKSVCEGGVYP